MARLLERDPEVERLIVAFHADLVATGQFAESEVISPARAFLLRVGGASGWAQLPTEEQSRWLEGRESRVVLWMMVAGHAPARPELLVRGHQRIGKVAAWVHRDFHPRFMQVADDIGFDGKSAELQWWAVAKVAAVAGVPPDTLSRAKFETARDQLIDAMLRLGPRSGHRTLSIRLFGAEATLYHAGVIDGQPRKRKENQAELRARQWASVPARLAETLQGYVEQMRVTLRPSSVPHVEARCASSRCGSEPGRPTCKQSAIFAAHISSVTSGTSPSAPTGAGRGARSGRSRARLARCGSAWSGSASGAARTRRCGR